MSESNEREEGWAQRALHERPWRTPEGRRLRCMGLADLFREFSDPQTTSGAARGLIQNVVLATGEHGNPMLRDSDDGRAIRELVVAFLTDIGSERMMDHREGRFEQDPEVRRTARRTLAQHVCPIVAAVRRTSYDSTIHPERRDVAALIPENLGTLTWIARFYGESTDTVKLNYAHVTELDGQHLRNVQDCLGRVYRLLREHIFPDQFSKNDLRTALSREAATAMRLLNQMFVDCCWWDVLALVRAVSALPELYERARRLRRDQAWNSRELVPATPPKASPDRLQFDWASFERHVCNANGACSSSFADRAFLERHRAAILHDLYAIQIVAGGAFDIMDDHLLRQLGGESSSLRGIRPLLLDLAATFVREVKLKNPGVLVGR